MPEGPDDEFPIDPDELEAAVKAIEASRGLPFLERFKALGLKPASDFAGGDWRNCDFSDSDLRGCDFRNTRLYFANFSRAMIEGADFRGASDVHTTRIHLAKDWRKATFNDYQIALIHVQLEKLRKYNEEKQQIFGADIGEKEWFYLIKTCPTFVEANELLGQMEAAGYPFNPFAYTYVLDRAKRDRKRKAGWELYHHYRGAGGVCDEALLTAAMGVSPSSEDALAIFNELREDLLAVGSVPEERTYNMAISEQDDNFRVAIGLFHDMKRRKVHISRYTIFALFDACQDFNHAVTVLIEAKACGIAIDDAEFLKELNNTTRYAELNEWNISGWLSEGLSYREVIRRLIWVIAKDPLRKTFNDALGFPDMSPFV